MRAKLVLSLLVASVVASARAAEPLRVGTFDVDASPPIGSPMAYNVTREVTTPLTCRGIVLIGKGKPIVLCAIDWIGVGNDGNKVFREELARAAKTTPDRVAVHALHQHDAPWCDLSVAALVDEVGIRETIFDSPFARDVMRRSAQGVAKAIQEAQPVTHLGVGQGVVEQVASSRRILGADGKVKHVRYTATADPAVRAYPEGVIDRNLKSISFWNADQKLVYATHPQSYYRTGQANPDFPGLARNQRQQATRVLHIHFNGAGGNIGAGKYNDGGHENRQVLADRVAAGMTRAWDDEKKLPISAEDVHWKSVAVALPVASHLDAAKLLEDVKNDQLPASRRIQLAGELVWLRRCLAGDTIDIGCLTLGTTRVLHMPGELFVEYQLLAQQLRPDLSVAMAAYGDYAPWYIGTRVAYQQGGYEPGPDASLVAPDVEGVLVKAIQILLEAENRDVEPLGVAAGKAEAAAAQ
ncbi:MAG: hypothetical protein NT069_11045 [Planctomycetota bacterium]|nr:hypothetical protein [Planctomycetota bacterium]